jgi:hypothetical protein
MSNFIDWQGLEERGDVMEYPNKNSVAKMSSNNHKRILP